MEDTSWLYDIACKNFYYKTDIECKEKRYGVVAEQVEQINKYMVVHDKDGAPYAMQDQHMIYPMLNEIQRLNAEVTELKSNISTLQAQMQSVLALLNK